MMLFRQGFVEVEQDVRDDGEARLFPGCSASAELVLIAHGGRARVSATRC